MEIYTIGFAQKSAASFFAALNAHGVQRVIDVRVSNLSQLAGFTKRDDLAFFLREIAGAEYVHEPLLAPEPEALKAYRAKQIDWEEYERRFLQLMRERQVERCLERRLFDGPSALLCSEAVDDRCHRRLVVEYLDACWGDVKSITL